MSGSPQSGEHDGLILAALACQPEMDVSYIRADADAASQTPFAVRTYDAENMRDWELEPEQKPRQMQSLEAFGRFACRRSSAVVARIEGTHSAHRTRWLSTPYSAQQLTRVPAVAAATILKRRWMPSRNPTNPPPHGPICAHYAVTVDRFRPPENLRPLNQPTRRLAAPGRTNSSRLPRPRPAVRRRRSKVSTSQAITDAGHLTAEQSAQIDLDSIAWFFQTLLAKRLRASSTRVFREWPSSLSASIPPATTLPQKNRRSGRASRPRHPRRVSSTLTTVGKSSTTRPDQIASEAVAQAASKNTAANLGIYSCRRPRRLAYPRPQTLARLFLSPARSSRSKRCGYSF